MSRLALMRIVGGIILSSGAWGTPGGAALAQTGPVRQPSKEEPARTNTAPEASDEVADPVVDRILTRLENRRISDLRAKVIWELEYMIEEEVTRKTGMIWYRQMEPVAKFKVRFDRKIVGNRSDKLDEEHLFDGRWYIELNSETKTVSKTELRPEGDTSDPYSLAEGSFPLPFGQKKAEILREFEVQRVAPSADDPEQTDHLVLRPRPGTRTGQTYASLDFWIAREEHGRLAGLPIKVQAAKRDGTGAVNSMIRVSFKDVELDTGFSASELRIVTPPGYEEVIEPLAPPASATVELGGGGGDKP